MATKSSTIRFGLFVLATWLILGGYLVAQDTVDETAERYTELAAVEIRTPPSHIEYAKSLRSGTVQNKAANNASSFDDGIRLYHVWNLEFEDAESCAKFDDERTHLISRFERFADIFIPENEDPYEIFEQAEDLVWSELSMFGIEPPPAPVIPKKEIPRDLPEPIIRNGLNGLTGKDVIIAVIDTGIDFHHPDFIDYSGQQPRSRILYFWDTASDSHLRNAGQPAPVTYPNGVPIGTVYTNDDLNREINHKNRPGIFTWDTNGHGTACAGIAAGNGNGTRTNFKAKDQISRHAGVAPEANIIAVKVSRNYGSDFENTYLMGAICDWLESLQEVKIENQPVVISCSWGGQFGGRDGFLIMERQLDARFSLDRRGRAICFAAGNSRTNNNHAFVEFGGKDDSGVIEWVAPAGGWIYIYFTSKRENMIAILESENKRRVQPYINGISGQAVVEVDVRAGRGRLRLFSTDSDKLSADAFINGFHFETSFVGDAVDDDVKVETPATASNVLSVGSYDWNDQFDYRGGVRTLRDAVTGGQITIGEISSYSSPGPTRNEGTKPEVAAPGQWFEAPAASNVQTMRDTTGFYQSFNGTSAATPYVAGVIALMFERDPTLEFGEIRELFTQNATQKPRSRYPNPDWGHGKLDKTAITKILAKLRARSAAKAESK